MKSLCTLSRVALALAVALPALHAGVASATQQRTFVSPNGNDVAQCSLIAPCRSFAAAIANTNPGGEVIVLDSAGYGKVTITQAVSIISPPGIYGGLSVFAGDDGITVNAGPTDKVTLRGLTINGQGGNNGVNFIAGGELEIDRCVVSGMGAGGIVVGAGAGSTTIADTVVERNAATGIAFASRASGTSVAVLNAVRAVGNQNGLALGDGARIRVRDSIFHRNAVNGVLTTVGNATLSATLDIANSLVSDNQSGIALTVSGAGGVIQALIADNVISEHSSAGVDAVTASAGAGSIHAVLVRNEIRGSATAKGIEAVNSNVELMIQGNAVSQTSIGVNVVSSAVVRSPGDNMVDNNTTNQSGAVVPVNAL